MKLTRIFSVLLLSVILLQNISAQKPGWTNYDERKAKFPDTRFYTGFCAQENHKNENEDEFLRRLANYARIQLTEGIQVNISSIAHINIENLNGTTHEYFKQTSVLHSELKVPGLKTETYYDSRKNTGYAFAYLNKPEISGYYGKSLANKKLVLISRINEAEQHMTEGGSQGALKNYLECLTIIREIEKIQSLMIAMGCRDDNILCIKEITDYKNRIEKGIEGLKKSEQLNLSDLCYFMASALKIQTGALDPPVRLSNFTYQDTHIGSSFSRRLSEVLKQKLIYDDGYNISAEDAYNSGEDSTTAGYYSLSGTYWEADSNLKIIAVLTDTEEGKSVASVEALLPVIWLRKNDISYKPENFDQAYSEMIKLSKDEITGGGMYIDIWTNKGKENLVYAKGEKLKLFVRANQKCYLRFIYHMADGSKILLLDNYYIGWDLANKTVEIPREFECTDPYGVETLQLVAQTDKFPPLNIKERYGFSFIVDDLDDILRNIRGFKPVSDENLKAEKRLVFTTVEK